ncbi:helix-turn-helix domain-containing protein [Candidatus Woesearchaeota archaeon]|nr:helix-turn-helix domain-containing protein [Candidatus Woesearchaeota archaeon]
MQEQDLIISSSDLDQLIAQKVNEQIEKLELDFKAKGSIELYSIKEVQQIFQVDRTTIHHWTKNGTLKAFHMGRRVYYRKSDIEQSLIQIN